MSLLGFSDSLTEPKKLCLVFRDDIKKFWACLGACRSRLVISQVSIRSLMKESVQRDYRSQLASHNTGPWCSGQGWGMQTMCRVTIITHPLFIRSFQKPEMRCWIWILNSSSLDSEYSDRSDTLGEHDYHILSTWHVSVSGPKCQLTAASLPSQLSLTIGCPDIWWWPGVARGRVQ